MLFIGQLFQPVAVQTLANGIWDVIGHLRLPSFFPNAHEAKKVNDNAQRVMGQGQRIFCCSVGLFFLVIVGFCFLGALLLCDRWSSFFIVAVWVSFWLWVCFWVLGDVFFFLFWWWWCFVLDECGLVLLSWLFFSLFFVLVLCFYFFMFVVLVCFFCVWFYLVVCGEVVFVFGFFFVGIFYWFFCFCFIIGVFFVLEFFLFWFCVLFWFVVGIFCECWWCFGCLVKFVVVCGYFVLYCLLWWVWKRSGVPSVNFSSFS